MLAQQNNFRACTPYVVEAIFSLERFTESVIAVGSFDLSPKSFKMRTSLIRLGKGFGQLPLSGGVGIRGVTKYHLSPFEQKAFAGVIKNGIPNFFRRVRGEFFNVVPRKSVIFF